jgi:hypothetical protein
VTGVCPLAAHLEGVVLRNGRSLWVLMPVSKGSSITGARGRTFWRPGVAPPGGREVGQGDGAHEQGQGI